MEEGELKRSIHSDTGISNGNRSCSVDINQSSYSKISKVSKPSLSTKGDAKSRDDKSCKTDQSISSYQSYKPRINYTRVEDKSLDILQRIKKPQSFKPKQEHRHFKQENRTNNWRYERSRSRERPFLKKREQKEGWRQPY